MNQVNKSDMMFLLLKYILAFSFVVLLFVLALCHPMIDQGYNVLAVVR